MAIIYSYENNNELLRSDKLVGTAATLYNGKFRRITKNFTLGQLSDFINLQYTNNIEEWVTDNFVPKVRTLSINGVTYDLSANRSWTVTGGNQNLQEVTDEGNETTNPLVVINNDGFYEQKSYISSSFIEISDKDIALNETTRVTLENSGIRRYNIVDGNYVLDLTDASNAVPSTETRVLKAPVLSADAIIATTDDIGTWGALNYPTWTSGTPFVKMTAAGTFALDTNTYLTSITSSDVTTALGYTPVTNARTLTINGTTYDLTADRSWTIAAGSGTVTSVGLSMPSAFTVSNSPITSAGTIAVTGAGSAAQYVRGDGTLANFPTSTGGGSSFNYYLNGSISQGTFGGDTYYQMSRTPILGGGANFTRTNGAGNGYIASFITDAGDPSLLNIPGGNWNLEFYFQASSGGGSPQFYGEIYKVSATNVFTLVASGSTNPEGITNGTTIDQYFTSIPVPQTSLLITDRIAIRIYVITGGRTITLHTENGNLCEVLTTFSTGLTALNGLTQQVQYLAIGTSGTDFNISSVTNTHTFNLPTASDTNRGALSSTDWSTFNNKAAKSTTPIVLKAKLTNSSTTGTADVVVDTLDLSVLGTTFCLDFLYRAKKVGTASQAIIKCFLNTTATLSGSPILLATFTSDTTSRLYHVLSRNFTYSGGVLVYAPTNIAANDLNVSSSQIVETTVDITNFKFMIFTIARGGGVGDTITSRDLKVIGYPPVN